MTAQRTAVCHFKFLSVAALLFAAVVSATVYGQAYTWVPTDPGQNNGNWTGGGRWGQGASYPNGIDVEAVIDLPAGEPAAGYFITLGVPNPGLTIGHLTINNPDPVAVPTYVNTTTIRPGGSAQNVPLKFQVTSGAATYTETSLGQLAGRTVIASNVPIELLSDLIVTQNHKNSSAENGGTDFSGPIIGTSDRTFTKEGTENILLRSTTQSYEGKYVINNGAIRIPDDSGAMKLSTGVTVNAGGQLQLGQADPGSVDWNFATGATLTLRGAGKASGINADGALRFQLAAGGGSISDFTNPVILAEDVRIAVTPGDGTLDTNIGVLSNIVSGTGGLAKTAAGILHLTADNEYEGNTQILNGTLGITNSFLHNDADVLISANGTFDLGFSGADEIRSLYIDNEQKAAGLWGRVGSIAELGADFESDRITGDGLLDVQVSSVVENADFDGDGDIDGADFLAWQRHVSIDDGTADLADGDANDDGNVNGADLEIWKGQFGPASIAAAASVPEPSGVALALAGMVGAGLVARRRRLRKQ